MWFLSRGSGRTCPSSFPSQDLRRPSPATRHATTHAQLPGHGTVGVHRLETEGDPGAASAARAVPSRQTTVISARWREIRSGEVETSVVSCPALLRCPGSQGAIRNGNLYCRQMRFFCRSPTGIRSALRAGSASMKSAPGGWLSRGSRLPTHSNRVPDPKRAHQRNALLSPVCCRREVRLPIAALLASRVHAPAVEDDGPSRLRRQPETG